MNKHDAVTALGALAHEHRLAVFRALVRAGPQGLAAGEIAKAVGVSAASLTFHMKELDRAGLTHSWRDGRFIRSSLRVDAMRGLVAFLTEDCCEGRPELCGSAIRDAGEVCRALEEKVE
jgi:DNA-binding transcriptional ArsR family regulator